MFAELGPYAWVAAGFAGLVAFSAGLLMLALARRLWVVTGYDARLAEKSGIVDPMRSTFERKRIYMGDFVLPSTALVEGKTFIECEIVGPAVLLFDAHNNITEPRYPKSDAVLIADRVPVYNAIWLRGCTFRGCTFSRVTFLFRRPEYEFGRDLQWLNWIGEEATQMLPLGPPQSQPEPEQIPPPVGENGK